MSWTYRLSGAVALACCLALSVNQSYADEEDGIPSFKTSTKRETKEFVERVGSAIVKAARSKPQSIELEKYEYTSPKPGRTELNMTLNWKGLVSKAKFTSTIKVIIDSGDKERWEVLNIEYKDTNKSPIGPSEKNIQQLIKKFNK
jgi:phenylpyruvate tautomerase PptA (4-oxalocrotonate tautomerase family)